MSSIQFSEDQEQAIFIISSWLKNIYFNADGRKFLDGSKKFIRLAGVGGSGKSFVINYLLNNISDIIPDSNSNRVKVATYTWKAALNLIERGTTARSIHSTFYKLDQHKFDTTGVMSFTPINVNEMRGMTDLIIIDEASMVGKTMREEILSYGIPVLFVGDHKQIPAIEDSMSKNNKEPPFMEKSEIKLETIHRQAEGNPIIQLATMARNGEFIPFGKYGKGIAKIRRSEITDNMLLSADQVICTYNKTRRDINHDIRYLKGYNLDTLPKIGEKMIVVNNNHELGLYNGEQLTLNTYVDPNNIDKSDLVIQNNLIEDSWKFVAGVSKFASNANITNLDPTCNLTDNTYARLKIDGYDFTYPDIEGMEEYRARAVLRKKGFLEVDFAYAITLHRSQGSAFNKVILYDEKMGKDKEYNDRLLYTGITRAKEKLIIAS